MTAPLSLTAALVLLSILALLAAGSRRAIGWTLVGAALVILGVSALANEWSTLSTLSRTVVAVSAGLVWAGLSTMTWGAWSAVRAKDQFVIGTRSPLAANIGITFAAAIGGALLYFLAPLLFAGGWEGVVAAAGVAGVGVLLSVLLPLTRIPHAIKWLDQRWLAPKREAYPCLERRGRIVAWVVIDAAFACLVFWQHLFVAVTSTLAIVVASHRLALDKGHAPKLPVVPIIAGLSLLTYLALISNISGADIGLGYPTILEAPFSLRAEALLALILGAGLWVMLGLWPFHGLGPGSVLALIAGILLAQWGTRIIPMGILHAAPLFAAVAVLAAFHAAATGRVGEYVAALGVLAAVAGVPHSWILFALASALALHRLSGKPSPTPGIERRELGGIVLIPILAFLLPGMLLGETVLTVAAVFAGVALFWPAREK
ncbi:MAG: hypothetical protein M3N43_15075 [Actinomycetota bacterium]|nr:hypothetical protein [Actinomycetota bacterium]